MWAFVFLAILAGGSYALLMPPLQVADEAAHLFRSYGVSRGICLAPEFTPLPFSVRRLHQTFPPSLETRRLVTWREISAWRAVELDVANTKYVRAIATNVYSCIPYLPSALAVRAATTLDASPLTLVYAGRFGNLGAYIAIVAVALALLPDFRAIALVLALMPMSLHQAASFSADGLTIAMSILAASVVLHLSNRPHASISKRESSGLALIMALTALCKSNVALVGLVGLLPRRAFQTWGRYAATLGLVLAAALGAAASWSWLNRDNALLFATKRMRGGANAISNAEAVLADPFGFFATVARTIWENGSTYFHQFVGLLGYGTIALPTWAIWLYGAVLLASPFMGTRWIRTSYPTRIVLGSVVVVGCLSTFFSLFLITGQAADPASGMTGTIEGVAGRYFIPFAFPALLALAIPFGKVWGARFGIFAWSVAAVVNAVALVEILRHYYTTERITIDTAVYDLKEATVVPLAGGSRLEQTLTPRFNDLVRLDLDVALYGRSIPTGHLVAKIYAGAGEALATQQLLLRDMTDGSSVSIRFDPPLDSKRAPLRIELSLSSAPPESVLGFYTTGGRQDLYAGGTLAVDGRDLLQRDLTFRAYRRGRNDSGVPRLTRATDSDDESSIREGDSEAP